MEQWIFSPLVPYVLAVLSLVLAVALFLTLKLEVGALAGRGRRERQAMEAELEAARGEIAALLDALAKVEASLRELEQVNGALVPPPPTRSGLNVTLRSQVLRRHRLGEEPACIATSLGLPLTEVNLLVKVNRLVLENL
ncbi:MAG TPA: hypothetical protein VN442_24590 [Bryobacteraceae bacterium]|nr:hypothetical protein [Bryobacteraceae bacterium]